MPPNPQDMKNKLVYCPACGRDFRLFRFFKVHLSAYWNGDKRHGDLRHKYRYIYTRDIDNKSPLFKPTLKINKKIWIPPTQTQ